MKKVFEILYFISILLLIFLLSPLLICVSIAILVTTGAPIIYRQKRVGKRGKVFILYKFRTMTRNADQKQKELRSLNEASGPVFKIHDDPRFTSIGKFLSHVGFDELPQLLNVLKGEMVLIGPRPLPVEETRKLTNWQRARHKVKPGIISPWIVNGYHSQSFSKWMKSDIEYIKYKTFSYDVIIVIQSVKFVTSMLIRELKLLVKTRTPTSVNNDLIRQRKVSRQFELGKLD